MKIGTPVVEGFLDNGKLPCADDSTIDDGLVAWKRLKVMLDESVNAGSTFSQGIVSTYSLINTLANAYIGGVLASNGDIHFIPYNASVGQKISSSGVVSTYSLVYTAISAYVGGVLAPNGDIHFIPNSASVGQKISVDGVVSTYSLVYTTTTAYYGGILTPNGNIQFIPYDGRQGQMISTNCELPFSLGICCSPFFNKI